MLRHLHCCSVILVFIILKHIQLNGTSMIHHYEDLYSASSRLLLKRATYACS